MLMLKGAIPRMDTQVKIDPCDTKWDPVQAVMILMKAIDLKLTTLESVQRAPEWATHFQFSQY